MRAGGLKTRESSRRSSGSGFGTAATATLVCVALMAWPAPVTGAAAGEAAELAPQGRVPNRFLSGERALHADQSPARRAPPQPAVGDRRLPAAGGQWRARVLGHLESLFAGAGLGVFQSPPFRRGGIPPGVLCEVRRRQSLPGDDLRPRHRPLEHRRRGRARAAAAEGSQTAEHRLRQSAQCRLGRRLAGRLHLRRREHERPVRGRRRRPGPGAAGPRGAAGQTGRRRRRAVVRARQPAGDHDAAESLRHRHPGHQRPDRSHAARFREAPGQVLRRLVLRPQRGAADAVPNLRRDDQPARHQADRLVHHAGERVREPRRRTPVSRRSARRFRGHLEVRHRRPGRAPPDRPHTGPRHTLGRSVLGTDRQPGRDQRRPERPAATWGHTWPCTTPRPTPGRPRWTT